MSCKQELEHINVLLNVDGAPKLIETLAKMGEDERKQILESLKIVASIAESVLMLGYDGDTEECVEQLIWDVENFEEDE